MAEDVKAPDIPDGGKNTPDIDNHSESENATEVPVSPEREPKDKGANSATRNIPRPFPSLFEARKSLAVTTRRLQQYVSHPGCPSILNVEFTDCFAIRQGKTLFLQALNI
jgi:hypothetical protein